ncbi:hypothetical protein [uncultured Cohaesibacter sp.]|uniref:hypothetical protein n=1 Tax=uncultured Cohaesibacter sp. TaxID=1002546 RepID=UPI0029C7CD0D|nr:hypothetical protein [uncultured Cohaesibacter sp.]
MFDADHRWNAAAFQLPASFFNGEERFACFAQMKKYNLAIAIFSGLALVALAIYYRPTNIDRCIYHAQKVPKLMQQNMSKEKVFLFTLEACANYK